ncbi:hypothetical protein CO112_03535 [Candidatus Dojkabacteria bacterium CG_4_9_14_3_um_filter_150_Dojkabacteria_WS6_41_13]|nr:MAG: hypothetical protein CO112_03535 [Candidatus Dojkabacteria bacterium CG_4_9_14_3_um_filter_150_Dojkabacteria_WS6_41_13]
MTIGTPLEAPRNDRLLHLESRNLSTEKGGRNQEAPQALMKKLHLLDIEREANKRGPWGLIEIELPTKDSTEINTRRAICILTAVPPTNPNETYGELLERVFGHSQLQLCNAKASYLYAKLDQRVNPNYVLCRLHDISTGRLHTLSDSFILINKDTGVVQNREHLLIDAYDVNPQGQPVDSDETIFPPLHIVCTPPYPTKVIAVTKLPIVFFDQTKITRAFPMNKRDSVPIAQPIKICLIPEDDTSRKSENGKQLYLDACAAAYRVLRK